MTVIALLGKVLYVSFGFDASEKAGCERGKGTLSVSMHNLLQVLLFLPMLLESGK